MYPTPHAVEVSILSDSLGPSSTVHTCNAAEHPKHSSMHGNHCGEHMEREREQAKIRQSPLRESQNKATQGKGNKPK